MVGFSRNLPTALMFTGFLLLVACKQEAAPEKVAGASPITQQKLQESQNEPVLQSENSGEKERMTSLYQVVSLLAAKNGTPWSSFDAVPGVQWRDTSPKANSDSTDPENARYRSGTLLLDGFVVVDVPDGGQGAEGGTKQANEGESGITLNGDAQSVQSIAVKKFYASPEYAEVLKRQLPMATAVRLIADKCVGDEEGAPDPLQTKFYAIDLDAGEAFVEAYLDDGTETRGPGSTTFVFTKTKPQKRIQALQCKES
ncbi:hypothetical protein FHY11_001571 [Xanthomonas arboricola]|uniref:hypothetical protein n=1 Tax=Xanthomonas euroxanthea TaxID=2259622 RepID=UPI001FBAFB28|nr:hypothetical protein [Xanthomonas euroxanthea]NIK08105.1 hypothetical protein [Xanthomonas euroxanthea]